MNPEPSTAATVEGQNELRVKVAELFGWKRRPDLDHAPYVHDPQRIRRIWEKAGKQCIPFELPKYESDLNACAEFEKGLTGWQPTNYKDHLWEIVGRDVFAWVTATAEQRCRAFIATNGSVQDVREGCK